MCIRLSLQKDNNNFKKLIICLCKKITYNNLRNISLNVFVLLLMQYVAVIFIYAVAIWPVTGEGGVLKTKTLKTLKTPKTPKLEKEDPFFYTCSLLLFQFTVVTKTRNEPQRSTTTHNDPQRPTTIHNDPQRPHNDPQ